MSADTDALIPEDRAARKLRVGKRKLASLVANGQIVAVNVAGKTCYSLRSVARFARGTTQRRECAGVSP